MGLNINILVEELILQKSLFPFFGGGGGRVLIPSYKEMDYKYLLSSLPTTFRVLALVLSLHQSHIPYNVF